RVRRLRRPGPDRDREGRHPRHEHQGRLGRGAQRPQRRRAPRRARERVAPERLDRESEQGRLPRRVGSGDHARLRRRRLPPRRRDASHGVGIGQGRPQAAWSSALSITDVSIKNPVFAWMIMACTMLFGIVAITRIGVSQYPDVDNPNITVSLSWTGASPPAVERQIVEPIEQAISQVEGVQSISSQARSGSARVTATFDMSRDVDLALQDIQAKVAQTQRSLPKDVAAPTISKSNPDDTAILTIGVSGPFSRQMLADTARYQVQERLQTVPGVGQITLNGVVDRNVRIWLDASKLAEKGVVASDITSAIAREHVEVPGGQLITGGRAL